MKKRVVISAINLFEGGTLSVLKDCLLSVDHSSVFEGYEFLALVHNKKLFAGCSYTRVKFVEFPKSRKSYVFRLYYEYFYFKKFAKKNKIDFWLSMHDMSPNIGTIPQAVYCHNPTPFNKIASFKILLQPTVFFFTLFYSYLYRINIKRNKYVIVQQLWIKEAFIKMFRLESAKVIVAKPQEPKLANNFVIKELASVEKVFVFPTFPRTFKNIEVIGEATKILNDSGITNFSVIVTVDGSENSYSKQICNKFEGIYSMRFIGLQSREKIIEWYERSDCLIFPSKLETWGLPISEYKQFNKPMLVADLPYARETVGNYNKVKFFDVENSEMLSNYMKQIIFQNSIIFDNTKSIVYPKPYAENWEELLQLLLN
ncbi:glycosyltransferase [Flavobacterium algicola]|uniref:glycosyltransferase n=1 Tax=Flavobacterium algicola TaxID=556529 RepID=UPI001EFDAB92|nr:glycosyltransferase [Flavobacterium algicola]MCG9793925.1 glycosyltransferase [Flavobacterium algicola]